MNDGFMRDYMDERYGNNTNLDIQELNNIETEEKQLERINEAEVEQSMNNTQPEIEVPEIPSMGSMDVASAPATPLSADQRVALAGDDLDEAIALGQRNV